ncbi:unnamed protein product [Bathycoccus prasinos]
MTTTTTSLSENNNKENDNIDSFFVVAGKMSASGSAATSATATAATATATNSSPKSSRKTKRWFSFVLENIERDARFRTMCTETLNKRLQKAYEKLTQRETQAHNKEWILLKMARFVLETNNAAGEEEREEEEEEYKEEEEREAAKNSMFARLRQILEETVESEREEEGQRNVPAPSSSNNSNYNNNFRNNRKRKVTTKEREEKTAAVAAVSSTTMIPLQCSRNDGKSWRCSALAVEGHKHCAKHLRWGYGARAANNAQHIASIANIIAAAEKNNKNNNKNNNNNNKLIHRNKDTRALEKKSRHLPKRRVNLSDAGEKQQRLREEKMYEQHRVEYERRMQKKIKSSVVQTTSSDGTNIACTIEVCDKNEEKEDDCLSENTSIPLFSRPGGSLKNSSSSSLSSLSSSSIGVMKTINLDDFSGYGPLREHLLKLAAGASSNSTGREISVVYWTAHNTAHQIALGEPYEYFKAKCVKLHAKVYPKASSSSGTGGGFRSIKIPLVAGPTSSSSSSSSSSPSATMYMMLMMQNDKNKNIFFPSNST